MISPVAACVFDAYGTLFDVASAAAKCRGALGDKATALAALWRQKQLEYTWLRSLMGAHADFRQVTEDGLDFALSQLGIDGESGRIRERLLQLYMTLDAFPEVPATLAALRRAGVVSAILSNGSPAMLAAAVRSAGIEGYLDHVLSVEEVGIYKPHPSVYRLAADRLRQPPARICFISANGWDAAGAARFGFRTVLIGRTRQTRERLPAAPEAEIASLAELPALIGVASAH